MRDIHNRLKFTSAIAPGAAVTNNTAYVSDILDTADFEANEVIWTVVSPDADATLTPLLEDGDVSTLSDNAAVADAYLLGTEALATEGAGTTPTKMVYKLGYKGTKRYIRLTLTPAANTGNLYVCATFIQGYPRTLPQSTQNIGS